MSWPTLHPRLSEPDVLARLREQFRQHRRIRIHDAYAPGLADELRRESAARPFDLYQQHEGTRFVYWHQVHPFDGAPGFVKRGEQLVMRDIPGFMGALTGVTHQPPPWHELTFNLLRKGSYLDPHSDHLPERLAGFVVGLTPGSWPHTDGGWLEFLEPDMHTVRERWPPGMGTLDILHFYPVMMWHEIPVLKQPHDRLTINGWMSG